MSFQEWIDKNELQQLQDDFCDVADIVAYCADEQKAAITRMSGKASEVEMAKHYVNDLQLQALLERVEDGSLEEQVSEDLNDGAGKVAAIAVKFVVVSKPSKEIRR